MELAVNAEHLRSASAADPHEVRRDIVIFGKDQAGSFDCDAEAGTVIPFVKEPEEPTAGELVMIARLFGHMKFPLDHFVTLTVVRHQQQIGGGELA